MAAMLGVASGRVVRSFEIQVAKATNGQKNGSAEESSVYLKESQCRAHEEKASGLNFHWKFIVRIFFCFNSWLVPIWHIDQ